MYRSPILYKAEQRRQISNYLKYRNIFKRKTVCSNQPVFKPNGVPVEEWPERKECTGGSSPGYPGGGTVYILHNGDVPLEWVAFSTQLVYEWVGISEEFWCWGIQLGHDLIDCDGRKRLLIGDPNFMAANVFCLVLFALWWRIGAMFGSKFTILVYDWV